jgi:uncharacterized SAM-binding protein YcdF (DUF218 family)
LSFIWRGTCDAGGAAPGLRRGARIASGETLNALFVLREVVRDLVLPPSGPLIVVLIGLWLLRSRPRLGRALATGGVLLLWLLATPLIADQLERLCERYPALAPAQHPEAQAIVILSASARPEAPEYSSDAPNQDTLERIAYGAYLAHATGLPVLVTGGLLYEQRPIAAAMAQFLERDFSTPVRWVEGRARDTHENALFSAAMLAPAGVHRIILVTGAMHMARSVAEFRAVGFEVIPAPVHLLTHQGWSPLRVIPEIEALERSHSAIYELLGRAVLAIRTAL